MTRSREPTVLRHGKGVRLAHLGFSVLIGVMVVSGLGVGEYLPAQMATALGGHVLLVTLHHLLGHALELLLLIAVYFGWERLREWFSAVVRFERFELGWPLAFLRFMLHPRRSRPPWHNGRFDPVQRVTFLVLGSSLLVVVVTGLAFNFVPSNARLLFAWTLRIHIVAAVALIISVCMHVFAGSGVLPSHRGVARAMFGDGRVRIAVGTRLWPGWTARQPPSTASREPLDASKSPLGPTRQPNSN